MKTIIKVTAFLLSLVVFSWAGSSHSKSEISKLIKEAEAKRVLAVKAHIEFKGSKKLIKEAKKALDKGNLDLAYEKALRVHTYGIRAFEQKKLADKHYKDAIPK